LGRDSLEGIARYRFGISPKGKPFYTRLRLTALGPHRYKGIHVIPRPPSSGPTDELLKIESQAAFYNARKQRYVYFLKNEIPSRDELESQGYELKDKEIYFFGEVEELVELLKQKGIDVKIGTIKEEVVDLPRGQIPVLVQARIDRDLLRAIAKIAFNYLAFNQGPSLLLTEYFNGARNFIMKGLVDSTDYVRIDKEPILHDEIRKKQRRTPGHIIILDWEGRALVVKMSLFNSVVRLTYTVILCKNYPIWFPIQKGHYFDPYSNDMKNLGSHIELL
jgi:hypothetical protein